jgi:hypothetical protein
LGEHLSERLKADIRKKYNIKTEIIGPAACAMAMSIDYNEMVQETNKTKTNQHHQQKRVGIKGRRGRPNCPNLHRHSSMEDKVRSVTR